MATDISLAVVRGCPAAAGVAAVTFPSHLSTATDVGAKVIDATVTAAVGGGSIDTRSAAFGIRAVKIVADSAGTTSIVAWIVAQYTAALRSTTCYTYDAALAAHVPCSVVGGSVAAVSEIVVSVGDYAAWKRPLQGAACLCTNAIRQNVNVSVTSVDFSITHNGENLENLDSCYTKFSRACATVLGTARSGWRTITALCQHQSPVAAICQAFNCWQQGFHMCWAPCLERHARSRPVDRR